MNAETSAAQTGPHWREGSVSSWIFATDHKRIGMLWLAVGGLGHLPRRDPRARQRAPDRPARRGPDRAGDVCQRRDDAGHAPDLRRHPSPRARSRGGHRPAPARGARAGAARPLGVRALAGRGRYRRRRALVVLEGRRSTLELDEHSEHRPRSVPPGRDRAPDGPVPDRAGDAPDGDRARRDVPWAPRTRDEQRPAAALRAVRRNLRNGSARARVDLAARERPPSARPEEPWLVRLVHRRRSQAWSTGTSGCSARPSSRSSSCRRSESPPRSWRRSTAGRSPTAVS